MKRNFGRFSPAGRLLRAAREQVLAEIVLAMSHQPPDAAPPWAATGRPVLHICRFEVVHVEAKVRQELPQLVLVVLPIVAAVRAVARVRVVDVLRPAIILVTFSSRLTFGVVRMSTPVRLEDALDLAQRDQRIARQVLDDLAEEDDVEVIVLERKVSVLDVEEG